MKQRNPIIIAFSLIAGILPICLLYINSNNINHQPNNFIRLFRPHTIDSVKGIDIKYNSFYISGVTSDRVYLGNTTAPYFILVVPNTLKDTLQLRIQVENGMRANLNNSQIRVDSPHFFIMDGIYPAILQGNLNNLHAVRSNYDSTFFTRAIPISKSSFALRTCRQNELNYILAKEQNELPHLKFAEGILQNQVDGLFSTDGILLYNSSQNILIYVYYHRNQFICTDTNLALVYRARTIDTTSYAKIKIVTINAGRTVTLATPSLVVNKRACTSNNLLFIHSGLMAKNEDKENFKQASVIDVYNLKKGKYRFSLYLFDYGNKKIGDFGICGNSIIALHDHHLVAYYLDPKIFQE